ncbi:unnamed protein product [Phytophthora lilii]|uniref:Unnamed protein product n=1 Tax=Phytophthora lilii TaxID=2077276 RepID=A0A9W6TYW8_9STRA|nr:unnamed protein product [Phytophthora lilii]
MARASKGEQQMRTVVHRMRSEAKQMEEVNEALQQRVKALMKENAYTLEQLQAARKMEREQKVIIAGMRSKLQLTQATQDEIDRLASEYKDVKQQLIRSNHDRDIFSASNNHLKEELAEVTKALHIVKVEKAQIESDFGTNYYRLQEETKKARQLTTELAARDEELKEKVALCAEQQQSLTSLKEELVSTLQRFEQTKRHLEDQLIEEERAREEMQEQNLEFRRLNKKLVRDLENINNHSMDMDIPSDEGDVSDKHENINPKKDRAQRPQGVNQAMTMRNNVRKKLDDLQYQLEWALMRENDLAGILARNSGGTGKPPALKRTLSRMPSKTVITRLPIPEGEVARSSTATSEATTAQETTQKTNESEANRANKKAAGTKQNDHPDQPDSSMKEDDESQEALEINEKNFEAYHKEVARMLTEVKEGKDKIAKQQKVITVCFSESVHEVSDNKALILELELDAVPPDDPNEASRDAEGGMQMMELQRKKREVRRKVLMDKAMKKFAIMCHNRAELIGVEMQKMRASFERMREDLDQAENKIDSDQLHIRTLEAEIAKLRLTVEMGKNNLGKMERSLLDEIKDLAEFRRRTNRSVEISAIPETTESEIQTDRWKPQGLILRQRNGPDRMPQRYLGKASVMIHCPELTRSSSSLGVNTSGPIPQNQDLGLGAISTSNGSMPVIMTDTDEHMRGLLELKVYPSIKAGGRHIKTSYASSRPKALSRLYLSSDGVSQKYIAPTPRQALNEGAQQRGSFDGRPSTVL